MNTSSPIRVMVVDDHMVVRNGIKFSLGAVDDIDLVGEAGDGREALHVCANTQPDVILMDMKMPDIDGVAATEAIKKQYPQIQVIALTSFQEPKLVQQALQAGATGYLLKDATFNELVTAIRTVHAGQSILSSGATEALLGGTATSPKAIQKLTPREQDVLALMVDGLGNEAIAEQLIITLSTVKFHIRNIFNKLNASNRAEATALAIKHRLLD